MSHNPSIGLLDGSFLAHAPDALANITTAASTPLPKSLRDRIKRTKSVVEIAKLLSADEGIKRFWRIALAALIRSKQLGMDLPELPADISAASDGLRSKALKNQPEIVRNEEFLDYAVKLMQSMEKETKDRSGIGKVGDRSAPTIISASSHLPSVRYVANGSAYACATYSLLDDRNELILEKEIGVEDLLFVAQGAISSAHGALCAAMQVVQPGRLVRHNEDSDLAARAQELSTQVESLVALLIKLPVSSTLEADPAYPI